MITLKDERLSNEQFIALIDKIKALIYVRVSTSDQAEHGYSIDSQMERCVKFAETKFKYTEDELLVIVEGGKSGDDPDRFGLNTTLDLIEKGLGKALIVLHPDRLSRYLSLQNEISQKVWNCGCELQFVEFDIDPNNPESMLMYNIQGSIAQYNKSKILANSKRGRFQMAKNGKIPVGKRVFGYTYDKLEDTLKPKQDEVAIFHEMVDMFLNRSMGCLAIAKKLSKLGYNPPSGNTWWNSTVKRILSNEVYTGVYHYGKTEIVQKNGKKTRVKKPREEWMSIPVEPLINKEIHQQILNQLDGNKTNKGRPSDENILKGLLRCGRCGSSVSIGRKSGATIKENRKSYYACTNRLRGFTNGESEECKGRSWRMDYVIEHVWEYAKKLIENPTEVIESISKQNNDKHKIDELLKKKMTTEEIIRSKREEKKRFMMLFASGTISSEEELNEYVNPINEILSENENELKHIDFRLENISIDNDQKDKLISHLNNFKKILEEDKMTNSNKKLIINSLFNKIVLNEDGTFNIHSAWVLDETTEGNSVQKMEQQPRETPQYICYDETIAITVKDKDYKPRQAWDKHLDKLDELRSVYQNEFLTLRELSERFNIDIRAIRNLFNEHDVKIYSKSERQAIMRKHDFLQFNKLLQEGFTLRKISDKFGRSYNYVKKVLSEFENKDRND